MDLMKAYRWACLACGLANSPEADRCARCQCPAGPTYRQIAAARAAAGIVESCEGPTAKELLSLVSRPFRRQEQASGIAAVTELSLYAVVLLALKACGW